MTEVPEDPREHERRAREHERHERSPAGEDEAGEPAGETATEEEPDRAAPPGTLNQQ